MHKLPKKDIPCDSNPFKLCLLLMLAGDIELNLGPIDWPAKCKYTEYFPCGICECEVDWSDIAFECDECKKNGITDPVSASHLHFMVTYMKMRSHVYVFTVILWTTLRYYAMSTMSTHQTDSILLLVYPEMIQSSTSKYQIYVYQRVLHRPLTAAQPTHRSSPTAHNTPAAPQPGQLVAPQVPALRPLR